MHRLTERAPAKINLTLRVLGRRADGFHDLVSLVAFAGAGDLLHLVPGAPLGLDLTGPTALAAGPAGDNLVLRAAAGFAALVPQARLGAFVLEKRLPVAAGLGGGSADAAAALRLLARLNDLPADDPRLFAVAQDVGSDVPACLDPRARIMRGRGEVLSAPLRIAPLACVLVNCGAAVPTAPVFRGLGLPPGARLAGPDHPDGLPPDADGVLAAIRAVPNDLEPPALTIAPAIGTAKALLAGGPEAQLVRMSGSGATVFALTADCRAAAALARRVKAAEPSWWVKPTMLR
ncbi:4-(cytidine 5'-diphospho)-2-C-methyl-D-erythritol kinase [Xanthobacter tagetidis]|uniref:4-diphosphocytidyl-2-C-methyl-D-erythritol kinase n=1 Tax=Xanthobacter tagetidis TaxID=60216 RepID=A0A3L7A529_9HYPH|nr:4-(cytidine 5'-diphospho)-2-C-methyl-D-erythritol kinase [Xanthobacter tagetidis]MBB6309970.1 4-diphosphocytidyl-2-C-methyl-D-erythritol kinase [Xanthobacter tagetidis]RLP74681.1 4-(cytidine 5'-diphospho)-2-C-methyl-D-erythritol kinase [Xanthobacter tagetidis]